MEPTSRVHPDDVSESVSELWGLPYQPVGCLKCGQAFLAPAEWAGKLCPHCLDGVLEAQPARLRREPPELMLPFLHTPAGLRGVAAALSPPGYGSRRMISTRPSCSSA